MEGVPLKSTNSRVPVATGVEARYPLQVGLKGNRLFGGSSTLTHIRMFITRLPPAAADPRRIKGKSQGPVLKHVRKPRDHL